MKNVRFTRKVTASVSLTPDQWQLFTSMPEASQAAREINAAAEAAIASSTRPSEALGKLYASMRAWAHVGALDSEPVYVAGELVNEAFLGPTGQESYND